MRKALSFAALLAALTLAACGGNPSQQNNQTAQDALSKEDFAAMQEVYDESEEDHGWMPLCKWQYVDLDGDGINEVWMRDRAEEYGACGGNPSQQNNQTAQDALSKEDFAAMQEVYDESEEDHGWMPLCKWQYVDLDGDGINEVWMRDRAEEYGAFFAVSDNSPVLIGIETERFKPFTREIQDGKGYFCKSGAAGGPSYYTEIVALKDSRIVERYNELQVYGKIDGAELNGEEINDEAAAAYKEALPEARELEPGEWNMLDLTDYDRVPAHENSAQDDKLIMDFITEMYNNSLYVEKDFLEEHCTPRMLQQLLDDYQYDGEGYAFWDFRSESTDGVDDANAVINIEKINGRYYYEANDSGYIFRNILSAFVKDGKVMFDGITVDATYEVFDPFADDGEGEEEYF